MYVAVPVPPLAERTPCQVANKLTSYDVPFEFFKSPFGGPSNLAKLFLNIGPEQTFNPATVLALHLP